MEIKQVRRYRKALRQFQQLAGGQYRNCCSRVSLAQCVVLLDVEEHERLTMGALAANMKLDQSTLSRTVDGLVKQKLLKRQRDENDRRRVWIGLTSEGRRLCQEMHEENDEYCRQVFRRLEASEQIDVIEKFEALVQAYAEHEEKALGSQ